VECAWAATRKKDGYLKRKYQSLITRRGKKKAIVAVGHKIIIAAYQIIKDKEPYKEPVLYNNPKRKARQINSLLNKLRELGFEINQTELVSVA
jgi:transposase